MKRASKYKSVKVTVDGIVFDSKREAKRYGELKIMQQAGLIELLETQPVYKLMKAIHGIDIQEIY